MKLLRLFIFVLVFAGAASVASAQGAVDPPRGSVSGFAGYAASVPDGLDSGHGFGGAASFFFSRTLGVEGGVRRQSFDVTRTDTNSLSGGELTANVVTANLVVRMSAGKVQPYVSGGLAFYLNDYSIDPAIEAQLQDFNFTSAETVDNTVGFNVGAGVDFQASRSFGVFVEGRFIAATADTLGSLTDQITQTTASLPGEQEMNVFAVSGGIRIYF